MTLLLMLSALLLYMLMMLLSTLGDSGEKSQRRFFRWFWDFLKVFLPVYVLKSFMLICFSKCNLHFKSVLVCLVLNVENITKMSHTQQWFY